jgi:thiol-disulfide isomerase/thioredoxin
MKRNLFVHTAILAAALAACTPSPRLNSGVWRGVVDIQGQDLPFNFSVTEEAGNTIVEIRNGEERLKLDEVRYSGDTVIMTLHTFDAELRAALRGDSLRGYFIKNHLSDYRLPFRAQYGDSFRFPADGHPADSGFSGRYSVSFTNASDTTEAVGIFKQEGLRVTGTFLTTTADYRFLEGTVSGGLMQVSTFDGNHAYLFTARRRGDTLTGEFWSGRSWHQVWTGVRNDSAKLPDAESLTWLKEGYNTLGFAFPDPDSNVVRLSDGRFRDKVVIVQLLGTWCPNCLDETRYLAPWYEQNRNRGVEVIGLAFEYKPDFGYAAGRVRKMKEKVGVNYPVLIAGTSDKAEASKSLPELNRVVAFPTTIFVGRDGKVKYIHTGFSGPATGAHYEEDLQRFNERVNELLNESAGEKD